MSDRFVSLSGLLLVQCPRCCREWMEGPVPGLSDVQQQWSETLARDGSVSFGRGTRLWRREPSVMVDQSGVHLPRMWHLDLSWDQVVDAYAIQVFRFSRHTLCVEPTPDALDGYPQALSWFSRFRLQNGTQARSWQSFIGIRGFDVSADELAAWINILIDERSTIPFELGLDPLDDEFPIVSYLTGRRVNPTRLPISWDLRNDLSSWATRLETADVGVPSWQAILDEGDHLAARLQDELGPDFTVVWSDEPEDPAGDSM